MTSEHINEPYSPYCSITLVNPAKVHPQWTLLTPSIQILYFKLIPTDANWNHFLCQAQDRPLKCILSHSNVGFTARECRLLASILTFEAEDEANLLEITLCWVLHKYSHLQSLPHEIILEDKTKQAVGTNHPSSDEQDRIIKINNTYTLFFTFGTGRHEKQLP